MPPRRLNRQERKEVTRNHLLDAAVRVCSREGVTGATLEAIAEEAGFTRGAIYSNFDSKDDLLLAVMEERLHHRATSLLTTMALAGSQPEDLSRQAGSFVGDAIRREREYFVLLCDFWSYAARRGNRKLARRFVAVRREYRDTLTEFVNSQADTFGVQLKVPAEVIAAGVLSLSVGLTFEVLVDSQLDPDAIYEAMIGFVYTALLSGSS